MENILLQLHQTHLQKVVVVVIVGFKADCLTRNLGLWMGLGLHEDLSRGVLARVHASFGENHRILRMASSTSATGNLTRYVPLTSFESRNNHPWRGANILN